MTDRTKYRTRYNADIAAGDVLAGDSDQAVTDYYNAADVTPDVEIRATREQVLEAIDITEFKALDAATRDTVRLVMAVESVALRGSNARAILLAAFGNSTTTRANLVALQTGLEAAVSRTRAQRGGILGNSLSISASDTSGMRAA